jgi:putative flippase GtrA
MKPEHEVHAQFVRYLAAGVCNTVVTYLLLILAMRWVDPLIAYTAVYVLGIAIGYWLQSRFVFRVALDWRAAARFPAVYLVQYALGASILRMLVHAFHVGSHIAALCAIAANIPAGFWMGRMTLARNPRRARRTGRATD